MYKKPELKVTLSSITLNVNMCIKRLPSLEDR